MAQRDIAVHPAHWDQRGFRVVVSRDQGDINARAVADPESGDLVCPTRKSEMTLCGIGARVPGPLLYSRSAIFWVSGDE
jgi:hypothetical protein